MSRSPEVLQKHKAGTSVNPYFFRCQKILTKVLQWPSIRYFFQFAQDIKAYTYKIMVSDFLLPVFQSGLCFKFRQILRNVWYICRFCHTGIILSRWFRKQSLCQVCGLLTNSNILLAIHQYLTKMKKCCGHLFLLSNCAQLFLGLKFIVSWKIMILRFSHRWPL